KIAEIKYLRKGFMSQLIAGVFSDSEAAGKAVAHLKTKGYTQHISVLAKDEQGEAKSHPVKEDVGEGIMTGAVSGGAIGAVVGLISGALSIAVPGAFLLVAGPLATAWGISGAVAGTLAGGLLGGLVKLGFPEEKAQAFERYIL